MKAAFLESTGAPDVIEAREPDIGTAPTWTLITKFPVRGPEGDVVAVGTVNLDISKRHAADVSTGYFSTETETEG